MDLIWILQSLLGLKEENKRKFQLGGVSFPYYVFSCLNRILNLIWKGYDLLLNFKILIKNYQKQIVLEGYGMVYLEDSETAGSRKYILILFFKIQIFEQPYLILVFWFNLMIWNLVYA
jgi:hypothetical protein